MSFVRRVIIALLATLLISGASFAAAGEYTFISAAEMQSRLSSGEPVTIIDIQIEEEFAHKHIKGALPTYAYPVKGDADRAKLDPSIVKLKANSDSVVIVCPRGGGGAKRTFDYLVQQGISAERLLILEKGQSGWPYEELTEGI